MDANRDAGQWGSWSTCPSTRHGPGWEAITGDVDGPEGWPLYLDRYTALLKEGR